MKKTKYNVITNIAIVLFLFVFCYAAYNLMGEYKEYKEIDNTYSDVINEVIIEEAEGASDDVQQVNQTKEKSKTFSINWPKLKSKNSDVIAWINIPGTRINYPVLKGKTTDEYIHLNINRKYSKGGSIFIDSRNQKPFEDKNTIIYGHNLNNGSMFSDIKKYKNKDFFENHKNIHIYLPDGSMLTYEVVLIMRTSEKDYSVYDPFVDDAAQYFNEIKSKGNIVDSSCNIKPDDKLISLSTCTNREKDERYVLLAVLK